MTDVIDVEAVEVPETAVTVIAERGLAVADSPKAMIALASELAAALKDIVERQRLYAVIQGKKYPQVEAWMTIGRMDNVVAREVEKPIRNEDGSWEAEVELVRLSDGMVVGHASAMCGGADDEPWSGTRARNGKPAQGPRPPHACRSMAVTRATSRAFRQQYSWIMALAGYEPTPADEMPQDDASHPVAGAPAILSDRRPPADPTAPWLDVTGMTATGVVKFGSPPMDGNLRETTEGPLFGFKLDVDDGKKIPQVALAGALALAAASAESLQGVTVTVHGDLWRVPWDKDGRKMPPFQRLVVTHIDTPDWSAPVPEAVATTVAVEQPIPQESEPPLDTLNPPRPICGALHEPTGLPCRIETHGARVLHKAADPETGELIAWS